MLSSDTPAPLSRHGSAQGGAAGTGRAGPHWATATATAMTGGAASWTADAPLHVTDCRKQGRLQETGATPGEGGGGACFSRGLGTLHGLPDAAFAENNT